MEIIMYEDQNGQMVPSNKFNSLKGKKALIECIGAEVTVFRNALMKYLVECGCAHDDRFIKVYDSICGLDENLIKFVTRSNSKYSRDDKLAAAYELASQLWILFAVNNLSGKLPIKVNENYLFNVIVSLFVDIEN